MLRDLKHRFVDGLILASLDLTEAHAVELERAAAPVIVIGRPTRAPASTRFAPTRAGALPRPCGTCMRSAAGGSRSSTARPTRRRARRAGSATWTASARAGSPATTPCCEVADDFMVEPGRDATERLLARARPDALLCANDLLAVGALAALREAGLDVPRDVALVGMDNSALSEVTWPTLTTVDLGSAERARIAAELLLERIEHPSGSRRWSACSRASSSAPPREVVVTAVPEATRPPSGAVGAVPASASPGARRRCS